MNPILETPRLILRELTINDAQNFYELNLNPEVIKYTGDSDFSNKEEAYIFLENYPDYKVNGFGRWAVIDKSTNNFIGWCGLKYDATRKETDIGFRFFENCWNKGFATESAEACLHYGLSILKIKSIIGRSMQNNHASIKVLEKIGMKFKAKISKEEKVWLVYEINQ